MSPAKRGDRVAPPAGDGQWELKVGTTDAAKGWGDLCQQAPRNTARAWETMRNEPVPTVQNSRHHRLKGELATGTCGGRDLPQWQIEVTGGGRIWYLVDEETRTVWVVQASTKHPKRTGG